MGGKLKNQIYITLVLSLLLVLHITSTQTYITKLLNSHSQQSIDRIWSAIPQIPEVGKKPIILYFEKDTNSATLGDSVLFGFPFHIALLYNLKESDVFPAATENWKDVVSAVTDGQSLKPYGFPLKPISIDQIYAFHLQGQDNLINITEEARRELAQ